MTSKAASAAFKLEWQKQMMRDHSIPMAQRALGAHLFNYAEGDGTGVYPGRARLCAELGISESTVDRALAALRNAGWIVRERRGSNTGRANMADVYRLAISETAVLGTYEPAVVGDEYPTGQSSSVTTGSGEAVVNHAGTTRQPCVDQSSSMREPLVTVDDLPDQLPNQLPNQGPGHVAHPGAEAQSGQGSVSADAPIPQRKSSARTWMDTARDLANQARYLDAEDRDCVEAEFVEANEPAQLPAAPEPPVLTVVKDNDAPDAFTAFLDAYPKPTPPSQRYAAHRAWQAAAKAHGADRVLKAAQRYTKALKDEGTDPTYAKKLADWFKDDSFDKHLPHWLEPYRGMNVVKWLDLVTERREVAIAKQYATGDTFLPQWPAEYEGWTKAEADAFRESDKDRWFREHRQLHLDVLTRRYGEASKAA